MKQLLLFLTLALSISQITFAQIPANDLFQNASLVDKAPFGDNNLRLDLATVSNGGQINCDIGGFQTVYYKFTAEANGPLNITLTDASNAAIGQTFAIVYSAPNLNITNENQLTLVSNCAFNPSTTVNVNQGTSYYILVNRTNGGTNFTNVSITIPLEVSQSEQDALVDFYNVTNGTSWINNTNWNTTNPVSTWHGLTVEKVNNVNHVTAISFNDNSITPNISASIQNLTQLKEFFIINSVNAFPPTGTIPSEIGSLSNLTTLWIENWNLQGSLPTEIGNLSAVQVLVIRGTACSGNLPASLVNLNSVDAMSLNNNDFFGAIPDLTPISNQLTFFRIQDNFFEFGDFETEFANYQSNIPGFTYSPQTGVLDGDTEITLNVGDNYQMFAVDVSGTNNQYQWYFNGQAINGETGDNLQLTNFQVSESGTYHCEVTHPIVTGLSITAGTFIVGQNPTSHPDYNALAALYNSTNGDTWTNSTNWLDPNQPVSNWYGITEENGRITAIVLNSNNLFGNIPLEITSMTELKNLSLQNNNLSGEIPSNIGDLVNLEFFMVWNNDPSAQYSKLSGTVPASFTNCTNLSFLAVGGHNLEGPIPDLTGLNNLSLFFIENNKFVFGDFENEFSTYSANIGSNFVYTPQQNQDENYIIEQTLNVGDNITLNSASISGINTFYQWYLGGNAIDGANSTSLELSNIQLNELGVYQCYAFNSLISGLTIRTGISTLNAPPTSNPDYDALVALYNSTNGDNWFNNTNWLDPTKPINTWYGVLTLDGTGNSRVTAINLNSNNLNGIIPDEIGDLTNLFNFYLSYNNLTGALPLTISNLTLMSGFEVINNNLAGELPDISNITDLSFVNIQNNKYVFADLESQYVNYNNKMGANFIYAPQQLIDDSYGIVTAIGAATTLNALTGLGSNLLIDWYKLDNLGNYTYLASGPTYNLTINTIADYGKYIYYVTSPTLTALGLESNPITVGPDPATHPDYNALLAIYNALDGSNWANPWDITAPIEIWDPAIVFDNMTNRVTSLYMNDQNISGQLPIEIGDLSELTYLGFSSQNITGTIPTEVSNLTNLTDLWLINCDLSGEVPSSIWTMSNLKNLLIGIQYSRQLTLNNGVPAAISNLQNLEWLNLTSIPIGQPLPDELFALPNLIRLRAAECGLSGTIPAGIANIDNVIISGNDYDGAIPAEIINSTGNSSLTLTNNYYDFTDLEPLVAANNYPTLFYSPQRTRDIAQSFEILPGDDIVMDVDDSGVGRTDTSTARANIYQWYKDNTAISGANGSTYTITNAQESDNGVYYCEISSSILPDLVIQRADITVVVGLNATVKMNLKIFLQGPLLNPSTPGLMNDILRENALLPTTSPYADPLIVNADVFNTGGTSGTGLPNDNIVDWVWVELRDGNDNTNKIIGRSALLQRDGDVVDIDGVSNLSVSGSAGNYFVVVNHRNHLGAMSAITKALSATALIVDFTDNGFSTFGANARVILTSGATALWAGNVASNGKAKFLGPDNGPNVIKDFVLADPGNGFNSVFHNSTGYLDIDVDLNGVGKFLGPANDSNIIKDNVLAHPGNGFGSPFYTISTTVPPEN